MNITSQEVEVLDCEVVEFVVYITHQIGNIKANTKIRYEDFVKQYDYSIDELIVGVMIIGEDGSVVVMKGVWE